MTDSRIKKTVLSGKELAERWDVTTAFLAEAVERGELNAIAGHGSGGHKKYAIAYVIKIEEQGGFSPAARDPLAIRRLEQEIERLKVENKRLRKIVETFLASAVRMWQEIGERK